MINGAVFISHRFGIPKIIIGLTIVAFGTSTPELFVGITSAIKQNASISFGNILGANLANIGLIVGLITLIHPIKIRTSTLKKDYPFVILAPLLLYLLAMDGILSRLDGVIFLIMAFLFIYYAVWSAGQAEREINGRVKSFVKDSVNKVETVKNFFNFILGLILLIIGAKFLVSSGVSLAEYFGISQVIIGITLISFGTVMPELFTSITAIIKKQAEISLGNVIGSTIFNVFVILGIVIIISPIIIPASIISFDLLFLIILTLILVTLLRTNDRIARIEGLILLITYFGYIAYLIYQASLMT